MLQADGTTPLTAADLPSTRALRGEEFDDIGFVARVREERRKRRCISWSAGARCATNWARSAARRWSITTSPPRGKSSASCISGRSSSDRHVDRRHRARLQQPPHRHHRHRRDARRGAETARRCGRRRPDRAGRRALPRFDAAPARLARRQPLLPGDVDVYGSVRGLAKLLRTRSATEPGSHVLARPCPPVSTRTTRQLRSQHGHQLARCDAGRRQAEIETPTSSSANPRAAIPTCDPAPMW